MDEKEIVEIVNKWYPKGFESQHEPFNVKVLRTLLMANACVLDLESIIKGERPLGYVQGYPISEDVKKKAS